MYTYTQKHTPSIRTPRTHTQAYKLTRTYLQYVHDDWEGEDVKLRSSDSFVSQDSDSADESRSMEDGGTLKFQDGGLRLRTQELFERHAQGSRCKEGEELKIVNLSKVKPKHMSPESRSSCRHVARDQGEPRADRRDERGKDRGKDRRQRTTREKLRNVRLKDREGDIREKRRKSGCAHGSQFKEEKGQMGLNVRKRRV
jgi:hypothetical protein